MYTSAQLQHIIIKRKNKTIFVNKHGTIFLYLLLKNVIQNDLEKNYFSSFSCNYCKRTNFKIICYRFIFWEALYFFLTNMFLKYRMLKRYYGQNNSDKYVQQSFWKDCIKCFSSEDYSATTLLHSFSVLRFSSRVCEGVFKSRHSPGTHFLMKKCIWTYYYVSVYFCIGVCLLIREREFECERGYMFPTLKFYQSLYLRPY